MPSPARAALDTNVLAYAEGLGDLRRCELARDLIAQLPVERILLPAQTLGELYRVLTGKAGISAEQARAGLISEAGAASPLRHRAPALIVGRYGIPLTMLPIRRVPV